MCIVTIFWHASSSHAGVGHEVGIQPDREVKAVDATQRQEYWRRNLRLMSVLLTIWAVVSFGAGILFVDFLNQVSFIGVPLGFWMAQQGSIITFVVLIAVYVWRMDRLDKEYGIEEFEQEAHQS